MTRADAETAPAHDRLLSSFRLTRGVAIQWVLVSSVGFFLATYLFGLAYELITGASLEPIAVSVATPFEALLGIVVFSLLVCLVVVPHELIHGLVMARYGARPTYGAGVSHFVLPYAYAKSDGTTYTRDQMLAVLLAPLIVITAVGLLAMTIYPSAILIVPLAANAAGSIGDLWMAVMLLRYPSSVRVAELPQGTGFGIYRSSTADSSEVEPASAPFVSAFFYGVVGTLVAITVGLCAALGGSLAFGSGNLVIGDPDSVWFLFRHEIDREELGAVFELGVPLLLALATLGGLVTAIGSMAVRRGG